MIVALAPDAIRARTRPFAILAYWLWEAAFALVVATPVHAWARRAWGTHPSGDAVLWAPGARDLLAWLGDEGPARVVVLRTSIALFALGIVLVQLPLGALLASLAFGRDEDGRPLRIARAASYGVRAFVPMGSLLVIAGCVELAAVGTFGFGAAATGDAVAARLGDMGAFVVRAVVTGLGLVLAGAVGAIVDIARAHVVQGVVSEDAPILGEAIAGVAPRGRVLGALRVIWKTPSRALRAALVAWAWRAAVGLVLVLVAAKVADALGGRGGLALALLACVHQGVVLGRAALRASWLARASRLAAAQRPSDL